MSEQVIGAELDPQTLVSGKEQEFLRLEPGPGLEPSLNGATPNAGEVEVPASEQPSGRHHAEASPNTLSGVASSDNLASPSPADRDSFLTAQAGRDAAHEEQERKARMLADTEAHQARRDLIKINQNRPELPEAHSRMRSGEILPSDDLAEMQDYDSLLPAGERIDGALLASERLRRIEAQYGPNSTEAMRALADDKIGGQLSAEAYAAHTRRATQERKEVRALADKYGSMSSEELAALPEAELFDAMGRPEVAAAIKSKEAKVVEILEAREKARALKTYLGSHPEAVENLTPAQLAEIRRIDPVLADRLDMALPRLRESENAGNNTTVDPVEGVPAKDDRHEDTKEFVRLASNLSTMSDAEVARWAVGMSPKEFAGISSEAPILAEHIRKRAEAGVKEIAGSLLEQTDENLRNIPPDRMRDTLALIRSFNPDLAARLDTRLRGEGQDVLIVGRPENWHPGGSTPAYRPYKPSERAEPERPSEVGVPQPAPDQAQPSAQTPGLGGEPEKGSDDDLLGFDDDPEGAGDDDPEGAGDHDVRVAGWPNGESPFAAPDSEVWQYGPYGDAPPQGWRERAGAFLKRHAKAITAAGLLALAAVGTSQISEGGGHQVPDHSIVIDASPTHSVIPETKTPEFRIHPGGHHDKPVAPVETRLGKYNRATGGGTIEDIARLNAPSDATPEQLQAYVGRIIRANAKSGVNWDNVRRLADDQVLDVPPYA